MVYSLSKCVKCRTTFFESSVTYARDKCLTDTPNFQKQGMPLCFWSGVPGGQLAHSTFTKSGSDPFWRLIRYFRGKQHTLFSVCMLPISNCGLGIFSIGRIKQRIDPNAESSLAKANDSVRLLAVSPSMCPCNLKNLANLVERFHCTGNGTAPTGKPVKCLTMTTVDVQILR